MKKWGLRKYGLQRSMGGATSGVVTGARRFHDRGARESAILQSLQYHLSKCALCQPGSSVCSAIQINTRLAEKHGPLTGEEMLQKLKLAEFYLAAKAFDDAWVLYAEILYRSQKCRDLDRLLMALEILHSAIHFNQQTAAKAHFAYLLLVGKDDSGAAAEPLWMMSLLYTMVFHTQGNLDSTVRHVQRAAGVVATADDDICRTQILRSQSKLTSEILRQNMTNPWLPSCGTAFDVTLARLMEPLVQWCLLQVMGDGYRGMLRCACAKLWTNALCLQSLEDFETGALFCFLWDRYRNAQAAPATAALSPKKEIVLTVERLEQELYIPPQMIFSTVSSMRADSGTVGLATKCADFSLEQIARQAVINLQTLTALLERRLGSYSRHLEDASTLFNKTYFSLGSKKYVTNERIEFRDAFRIFVRQFAQAHFPRSIFSQPLEEPERYTWRTAAMGGSTGLVDRTNVECVDTESAWFGQGSAVRLAIPAPPTAVLPSKSTSPPPTPTVRPMSGTLPTIREVSKGPTSPETVDMLANPHSSLSSSKASLRSFQRFGRGITELLLKRGGGGANQLPSEVMDRDSHSSWSLRRLTGVSYLSAASEITANGDTEQDVVMEDADWGA